QRVENEPALALCFDQVRVAQNSQMVGYRHDLDCQAFGQITDAAGARSQGTDDAQSKRLAESFKLLGAMNGLQRIFGHGAKRCLTNEKCGRASLAVPFAL